jgi:drug/metabolite transporter (DMT)-like permease
MTAGIGIALAFIAMLAWGLGDFSIQRSARKIGDWETLFVITLFGSLILLPFVWKNLSQLASGITPATSILILAGVVLTVAAMLHFEGFKRGKLSVLEPLISFEIPSASILAFFVLGDHVSGIQIIAIIILVACLFMVSFRERRLTKKYLLEKGVIYLVCGAAFMGVSDFLLGWGSRVIDPITANFILNVTMVVISGAIILFTGKTLRLVRDVRSNPVLILVMSVADNIGWVAYAVAMTLVPIAVATGLSESSIVIAVLLGLFINKEKLQRHQKIGLVGAIAAAILLAMVTSA